MGKNEPNKSSHFLYPLLIELDGEKMARTYSIGEISPVPERHECQLPNAPKNIENAQILGENEPKLYEGVAQSIEFLNTFFFIK